MSDRPLSTTERLLDAERGPSGGVLVPVAPCGRISDEWCDPYESCCRRSGPAEKVEMWPAPSTPAGPSDDLLERAVNAYHTEYHRNWTPGGDAGDHAEAHRCGIEAVLVLPAISPERAAFARMHDTLRAILGVVSLDEPYPWESGALKQQIREDLTAYEALGLDAARHYDPITGRRREENA